MRNTAWKASKNHWRFTSRRLLHRWRLVFRRFLFRNRRRFNRR
jgi:hypothetical protein